MKKGKLDSFPNYEIYLDGRIYSLKSNKFLKPTKYNNGYYYVTLSGKKMAIHRLLAMLFIPNPKNKPQVNHIDSDRTNNSVSNLEWVTSQENIIHGLNKRGGAATRSLSNSQVYEIRRLFALGKYPKEVSKITGINYHIVSKIKQGVNYGRI